MAPPSSSWRNPPAALQIQYNLTSLPDDFEPTPQEEELLEMYETVKQYEKEAARLKEEAARSKLEAAAAKYQELVSPSKKIKKKKKKMDVKTGMEEYNSHPQMEDDDEESDDEDDEDQQPVSLAARRAAKLAEWKEEIDEATKEDQKGEQMRAQLLGDKAEEDQDLGPSLIKKRKVNTSEENKASLISNISLQVTPPHDFSKKLEIKSWDGKVLFPNNKKDGPFWTPPASAFNPNDEALWFELDGFEMSKSKGGKTNNTIAIKYMAPIDSKRFSINIAGPDHRDYDSVLFHFNPRQFEKGGQLVLNNKQEGMWGQAVNVPLSRIPKIFGETASTVVIQIHEEGFDVFIEDKHCARLEHREDVKSGGKLYLQFPATDDRGKTESWNVYKVWWGHKQIMAKEDLTDVYGVNAFVGMHPKKLFIKGLSVISSDAEVDLRRAQLERSFRKYGGDRGVSVTVPTNATFAFVECATEQQANLALEEMAGEYDIKRARRKRHEALQEDRAAAAAGEGKENAEWD